MINQVGTLSPYYQNLASGAFLLAAVIVQTMLTGRRHGAARGAGATRRSAAAASWSMASQSAGSAWGFEPARLLMGNAQLHAR